jgi:tetratricopeptide (TPR) repeat protein
MRKTGQIALALICGAALLTAQAKQPKPKSQKEIDAIMAIQNAQNAADRYTAIDNLLTKFADTEFKSMVLEMGAATAQQANDSEKMILYGERALEANPKSFQAMLILGQAWVQRTKEFDLDKEEKLARAEKYAKDSIETLKTAEKPRPEITDEQWTAAKKDLESQAHEVLGTAAMTRKKFDVAATEYKTASEVAATPDPATLVRLGSAYNSAGKYDEAVAVLDKALAMPDAHPQVKQIAQAEKARAAKLKSGAAKPAAPGAAPVPQVEIKKLGRIGDARGSGFTRNGSRL